MFRMTPSIVSVKSCSANQGGVCNAGFSSSSARISGASAGGLVGSSGLGVLSFSCLTAGTSQLSLSVAILANATIGAPQEVTASLRNGVIACRGVGTVGGVDCSGRVDPVDATFILQLHAAMISVLSCPQNADANGDGRDDIIDATVILQYSAGLIQSMQP